MITVPAWRSRSSHRSASASPLRGPRLSTTTYSASNAKANLERTHGIDALDRFTAGDVKNVWLPIVQAEKDRQWQIYLQSTQQQRGA